MFVTLVAKCEICNEFIMAVIEVNADNITKSVEIGMVQLFLFHKLFLMGLCQL